MHLLSFSLSASSFAVLLSVLLTVHAHFILGYFRFVMRNYIRYIRYMYIVAVAVGRSEVRWDVVCTILAPSWLDCAFTLRDDVP